MAKKNNKQKLIIAGVGGGSVATVILAAVFLFGIGFDILPVQGTVLVPDFDDEVILDIPDDVIDIIEQPTPQQTPDPTPQQIIYNTTVTSNSTIPEQVIEQILPKVIKLEGNIVKIDSSGNKFPETFSIDIPKLSLFVDDITNIDFRTGFIELDMSLIGDPDSSLVATGEFDVLVDNQTIFTQDVALGTSGNTDSSGKISMNFNGASMYTFDFNANFAKFPNEKLTKLSFVIKSLEITMGEDTYGISGQEFFVMDIFRDDFMVLITDSEGKQIRSYLQDSTLKITSNPSTVAGYSIRVTGCPYGGSPPPTTTYSATNNIPAVPISVKIIDTATGLIIDAGAGTGTVIDIKLLRNHNYTIDHNVIDSPRSKDPFTILTPKTQANFNYNVWTDGVYTKQGPFTGSSGLCTITTYLYTPVAGSNFITSNFPK